jgi:hypothetical protein
MSAILLNEGTIRRTSKRIAGLAGVASLALIFAGPTWAQSKAAQSEMAPAQSAAALPETSPNAKPPSADSATLGRAAKTTQGTAQSPSAKTRSPKAENEGITVHGHWNIDIRNPDGNLVKHVEFENSIDPGFSLPEVTNGTSSSPISIPGGAELLNAALNGQAAPDPTAWGIMLVGPAGLTNLSNTTNAPCISTLTNNLSSATTTGPIDACVLLPGAGTNNFGGFAGIVPENCGVSIPSGVSCNTVSAPVGTNPNLTGLQISGSIVATQTGQIGTVATLNFHLCGNLQPGTLFCPSSTLFGFASLTSSSNFPNSPINVTAGQTVAVSVAISFH